MNHQRIDSILLKKIPWVASKQFDVFMDQTKITQNRFDIGNMIKILYPLTKTSLNFTQLYSNSKIQFKKSFLSYLHLSLDMDFIVKNDDGGIVSYRLTSKGTSFLQLFL